MRSRWPTKLTSKDRKSIVVGIIVTVLGGIILVIILGMVGIFGNAIRESLPKLWEDDNPSPTPSSALPSPTQEPIPVNLFEHLDSPDAETRKSAIVVLEYQLKSSTDPNKRTAILRRLVAFVRDSAPNLPAGGSYGYCLQEPPPEYPQDTSLALTAIGSRLVEEREFPIDLSNTNLAYAILRDLDFSHITFDGALMCRMFLNRTDFSNASLAGANLRFADMPEATGLSPGQLLKAESFHKATLPPDLLTHSGISSRWQTDPEL
jgi:Pentapeptide repeats (8 copies)